MSVAITSGGAASDGDASDGDSSDGGAPDGDASDGGAIAGFGKWAAAAALGGWLATARGTAGGDEFALETAGGSEARASGVAVAVAAAAVAAGSIADASGGVMTAGRTPASARTDATSVEPVLSVRLAGGAAPSLTGRQCMGARSTTDSGPTSPRVVVTAGGELRTSDHPAVDGPRSVGGSSRAATGIANG